MIKIKGKLWLLVLCLSFIFYIALASPPRQPAEENTKQQSSDLYDAKGENGGINEGDSTDGTRSTNEGSEFHPADSAQTISAPLDNKNIDNPQPIYEKFFYTVSTHCLMSRFNLRLEQEMGRMNYVSRRVQSIF